ncbi:MAG TPA: hypothetical protein ACFYED_06540 [Candidatus Tripitaka californicus]
MNIWVAYTIGYLFAIIVAHFSISLVVDRLWNSIGWEKDKDSELRPESHLPRILGCVERALYTASFQLDKSEFIGVWLALKVAGQWKRWGEDMEYGGRKIIGRTFYNIFLIGNALSIAYAIVSAKVIGWCLQREWSLAIGVPTSLLLATLVLLYWVGRYKKYS